MRNLFMVALVFVLLAGVQGCALFDYTAAQPSIGWNFTIGRPSTLLTTQPAIVNQTNGPVGVQPMGSLNGLSPSIIHAPLPMGPAPTMTRRGELFTGPACDPGACGDCTPSQMCEKLNKILDALGTKREE